MKFLEAAIMPELKERSQTDLESSLILILLS